MTSQWFHDSVAAGYSVAEEDYDVDRERGEAGEAGVDGEAGEDGASRISRKRYIITLLHTEWGEPWDFPPLA